MSEAKLEVKAIVDAKAASTPAASTPAASTPAAASAAAASASTSPALAPGGPARLAPLDTDEAKAFKWYLKAAQNGLLSAIEAVIDCYDNGIGTAKDESKGFEWCKTMCRSPGDRGWFLLGERYETGKGVKVSLEEAKRHYRECATKDCHVEAMFRVAKLLSQENIQGKRVFYPIREAPVDWYTDAATLGHVDAMYETGMCFAYGKGGANKCVEMGQVYFCQAADKGSCLSMYEIGLYCRDGDPKQKVIAAKWFQKAAELGHVKSMYAFGECLEKGVGAAKNEAKAADWYTKAAHLKNVDAMRALAACYKNGRGVAKSIDMFVEWCTAAADHGNAEAMLMLGDYYRKVAQEPEDADNSPMAEAPRLALHCTIF